MIQKKLKGSKNIFLLVILFCMLGFLDAHSQGSDTLDIGIEFYATGWMGDGEQGTKYLELIEAWQEDPQSIPYCYKIIYKKFGTEKWAGIYWQNEPDNWGDKPGEDLSEKGYNTVIFWARGEKGGEIVEFKIGSINTPGKKYKDSFTSKSKKIILEKEWRRYHLSLINKDLSCVIGGFCWVANKSGNPNGLIFYLDDIQYINITQ